MEVTRRPGDLTRDELRFMHHKVNFFACVDELDSAQAIAKGLVASLRTSEPSD